MLKLSEQALRQKIKAKETFECELEDGSLTLKIEAYAPVICTAIHAGHRMTDKIAEHCLLNEAERLYEEDPFTDQFIQSMPITIVANDSRYQYDLNRPLATCIYKKAWGKQVWKSALPNKERKVSVDRHQCFYRILDTLISVLETMYGSCLVFDVHSYNYQRHTQTTPTFNLGIEQVDMDRWGNVIHHFRRGLNRIELSNNKVHAGCNEIFYGRGYLISHINGRFQNTLVIPTELKKVYMDERSGEPYPKILNELNVGFKECLTDTAAFFSRRHTKKLRAQKSDMLSDVIEPSLLKLDRQLHRLASDLETLKYINPLNIQQERKRFFAQKGNYEPNFIYRPLKIDPYQFREQLYRLPVDEVRDAAIQQMYRDVIDALSSKIDMLVNAGQPQFVYDSLKYYGEPSLEDERNALFLLHACEFETPEPKNIGTNQLLCMFKQAAEQWDMQCRIESSNKLVAQAMVSNGKRTVYVNKQVNMSEYEANALIHHELGVHMATTLNAAQQPLKIFSLGLPGNTETQEGLAILNEYLSGNLRLERLKTLSLRVIAVKEMLKHHDFKHTCVYLVEEFGMTQEDAFKLAVRVHRSGGFTKDYLYLKGLAEAVRLYHQQDISALFIGKTSFKYLPLLNELIARNWLPKPSYIPTFLQKPEPNSEILSYLINTIQTSPLKPIAA